MEKLAATQAGEIIVVEPNIKELPQKLIDHSVIAQPFDIALENANVVAVLVDHREFKAIPKTSLNSKVVIDTRGILF